MARIKDKSKAIGLRKKGMSYSQIKTKLGISKSTLSGWLNNMPLSEKRIRELRDFNPMRIERCRNTKMKKRQARLDFVYGKVAKDIRKLSKRELLIAGLFLYWAEGGKTGKYNVTFSNTDPRMIKFFIQWVISCFGVKKNKISFLLHLYKDMEIEKSIDFWVKRLGVKRRQFSKPYIKDSNLSGLTYRTGFGKGTCNVRIYSRDISEYVLQSINYLGNMF